jgi:hypothetical protein
MAVLVQTFRFANNIPITSHFPSSNPLLWGVGCNAV